MIIAKEREGKREVNIYSIIHNYTNALYFRTNIIEFTTTERLGSKRATEATDRFHPDLGGGSNPPTTNDDERSYVTKCVTQLAT